METSDKRIFAEHLIAMGQAYERQIPQAMAAMYFDDLREFPLADVLAAFSAHRKDPDRGRFFPKVADVIDKLRADEVSHEQAAALAWIEVRRLAQDSGRATSSDAVAERVVQDLGGWAEIGRTPPDKLVWVEKAFVQRYQIYAEHGSTDPQQLLARRRGLSLVGQSVPRGTAGSQKLLGGPDEESDEA